MSASAWLARFGALVSGSALRNPQAAALVDFVRRYAETVATFVEARRQDDRELVVLDIRTGAPQAPVHRIRWTERVGILFWREGDMPLVTMLRDDFPDTEKQLLAPVGWPALICIDDRPWAEALLTWTPSELIDRILMWFRRAAHGDLHDARQPLEPFLAGTPLSLIIERSILASTTTEDLIAEHDPANAMIPRIKRAAEIGETPKALERICIATYRVQPARMQRLRTTPVTLNEVAAMLQDRGIALYDDLTGRFTKWLDEGEAAAWRLNARFVVIVEMPIVSPLGEQQDGVDLRAFLTARSAGDIAIALGVAFKANGQQGSGVGYVRNVGPRAVDRQLVDALAVQPVEVHLDFDRPLATRLAGGKARDIRKAVLIGAGAMGSHLADCLIREGRFKWTVIDDDRLLPHNLARHVARNDQTSLPKAVLLADHLNATLVGELVARPVVANLLADGEPGTAVANVLDEADLIIDASASIVAARFLSDHEALARRLSTFFAPSGDATILLVERADRALTLRDLEAQYLRLVLRTGRLAGHLGRPPETIAYTGACRAITNRIPQSRVSILAGLAAGAVATAADRREAVIAIWTLTPKTEITLDSVRPEPVSRYRAHGWQITFDAGLAADIRAMRDARLPAETGGMLFGLLIFRASRSTSLRRRRHRLTAKSSRTRLSEAHGTLKS